MGVQAIFMGWGAALPIPPGMDLPFGMAGAAPLPGGRGRREAAGEGAFGKNLARERPPHPALRADLSPRGRGEAWLTIAGALKAIAMSFPRKGGNGHCGFDEGFEQTRRLREYCLLRGRVGL
ncbi:hypothetical protein ASG47_02215 [Devosia sp. Leaf420]|nr:hypothetical protein ASG47_02215 [Devosia sp. Leaf420]